MTARPIIFSAPMVRAIIDGRKTQTRRVLKRRGYDLASCPRATLCDGELIQFQHPRGGPYTCVRTPYAPGDRLWVRENTLRTPAGIAYAADGGEHHGAGGRLPVTPSIHMPRWASRLTLVVTGVKVERLQEISREDAIAEGCESPLIGTEAPAPAHGVYLADERTSFAQLWNRLHGEGAWRTNPWIVAVSFVTHMRNIDHE